MSTETVFSLLIEMYDQILLERYVAGGAAFDGLDGQEGARERAAVEAGELYQMFLDNQSTFRFEYETAAVSAQGTGEAELDGHGRSQQAGDDAQGQSEVQSAARVHHGYHRQNHYRVPAETVDCVTDLCGEIRPHHGRQDEQRQKESGDDHSGKAEIMNEFRDFAFQSGTGCIICIFSHAVSPLFNLTDHQQAEFFRRFGSRQDSSYLTARNNGDAVTGCPQFLKLGRNHHYRDAVFPVKLLEGVQNQ